MREFNLEEAKAGKPVCTRDGRNVRIICFDIKNKHYPIAALIEDKDGIELLNTFCLNGRLNYCIQAQVDGSLEDNSFDLFMKTEKHEGWVNILVGSSTTSNLNRYFSGIFSTKEEAQQYNTDNIVDCVKIEWEE